MIRPLFDRIIVRRLMEPEDQKKLIVLPDAAQEPPTRAAVLAVGPGAVYEAPGGIWRDRPMSVKVGDVILFGRYTGQEIMVDGEKLLIMREEDVIAVE